MNFTETEKIYLDAILYNWDMGPEHLESLLKNKACDKATALFIYWESDPGFYYQYESVNEIPSWAIPGYELMKMAEQSILNDAYPELISDEPDEYRIPKDQNILKKIPPKLLLPSVGKRDGKNLANQFYFGQSLLDACYKGDLEKVAELLEKGYDIIDICIDGETPVYNAIKKTKVLDFLLSKGADANNPGDKIELLPIHSAAIRNLIPAMKTFIKHGVDVNAQTVRTKKTCLHLILGLSHDNVDWLSGKNSKTLEFLLKNGADLNLKDADGNTALALAIAEKNERALTIIEAFSK